MSNSTRWLVPFFLAAGGLWSQDTSLATASHTYANLPATFEINRGQTDPAVQFLARNHGSTVYVTKTEVVVTLAGKPEVTRLKFVGENRGVVVEPLGPSEGISNYFIG